MKKLLVLSILLMLISIKTFSQMHTKSELIKYFDKAENLDPIEGLWSLNVIRTLYYYDDVIAQETEQVRSEWGIIRKDKYSFQVINIGEHPENENEDFNAYFENSAIAGLYTYKCTFNNPNWTVKTNAELTNGLFLEYSYFVDETYMKFAYKRKYKPGLKLHWKFIWTKKYPTIDISNKKNEINDDWKGNGTGFFISREGYLATNYHVIEKAQQIELEFIRNGQKQNYKAKVIQIDKQNDLAILKIDDINFITFTKIPYNFQTSLLDVGTNVFALGYPMALSIMGTEIKFTDGKISSKTGYQGEISTYQTSTPIQPGNSGGPLFDFDGNLIGITSAKIKSDLADNVSYAIKINYLKNLIEVLPTNINLPNDKTIASKTLTEKIKILSEFVVLIKVK